MLKIDDSNWAYFMAARVSSTDSYIQFSHIDEEDEKIGLSHISIPRPDQIIMRKELFEKLSDEAKQLINLILIDIPYEIASPVTHKISLDTIEIYLRTKLRWKKKVRVRVITEIKLMIQEL